MKKIVLVFFLVSSVFVTACGANESQGNNNGDVDQTEDAQMNNEAESEVNDSSNTAEEENEEEAITEGENSETEAAEEEASQEEQSTGSSDIESIFASVKEAMAEVNSMHMNIESERAIDDNGEKKATFTAILGSILFEEPVNFYQSIYVQENSGQATETEMYRVEDKLYLSDPASDRWGVATIDGNSGQESLFMLDPANLLNGVDSLDDVFTLTEEDGEYVLTHSGNGEIMKSLIRDVIEINEDPLSKRYFANSFENFVFSGIYELRVDKETSYITNILVELEGNLEAELSQTTINEQFKVTYDGFDQLEEITVPEEVVENAEQIGG